MVAKTGHEPVERVAGFVVLTAADRPLRRNRFSEDVWLPLVRRMVGHCGSLHREGAERPCGFCRFAGQDHPTFHDLRHFYASALIAGGASVTQVQARLGHSTATETLNTYSHL